jgi:hypothetical protein
LQRVSLHWLTQQIENIASLDRLALSDGREQVSFALYIAKDSLTQLVNNSVYRPYIRVSIEKAGLLLKRLNEIHEGLPEDSTGHALTEMQLFMLQSSHNDFRTVFLSEIATFPVYLVLPKSVFDVERLIEYGSMLFPELLINRVPEAIVDAEEAGKCLAFERYTASGFHLFRVVEAVLRRYWDNVTTGKVRPDPATLGRISADLENLKLGDAKVLEALRQLTKLHRNPLAHPDVSLDSDEAIMLVGMARSAVTPMLSHLPIIT